VRDQPCEGSDGHEDRQDVEVEDLEEALKVELSDRDEDTIGGVVLSELGRNPAVGDKVAVGPVTIEVLEVQHNRINTVAVTVHQPETVPPEEKA